MLYLCPSTQIALRNTLLIQLIYMLNYTLKHFNRITNEDIEVNHYLIIEFPITINSNSQSFIPFELG